MCVRGTHGVLRFDATVQARHDVMFTRLGWERVCDTVVAETPHVLMRWPIDRVQRLVQSTKAVLSDALAPFDADRTRSGALDFAATTVHLCRPPM